jgi:hypothetical protein
MTPEISNQFVPQESVMILETSPDQGKTFGPVAFLRLDRITLDPIKPDWYGFYCREALRASSMASS